MKQNIFDIKIDFKELDNEIKEFVNTQNSDPYLIMSKDTAKVITNQCCKFRVDLSNIKEYGRLRQYKGYKVLIDDDLSIGDVDIR